MKYKACVTRVDMDYGAYVNTYIVPTNSWDDAEYYCEKKSRCGSFYYVDYLVDTETNITYNHKKELTNEV